MAVHSKMAHGSGRGARSAAVLGGLGVAGLALASRSSAGFAVSGARPAAAQQLRGSTTVGSDSLHHASAARAQEGFSATSGLAITSAATAAVGVAASMGHRSRAARRPQPKAVTVMQSSTDSKDDAATFVQELSIIAAELMAKGISEPLVVERSIKRLQGLAMSELQRNASSASSAVTRAFEEVLSGAQDALNSPSRDMGRWAASATASLLLMSTVTIEPANADNQVAYSEFLQEVQKGNVEMVRVQNDMMTASYTSKDGSRHDVNLLPNAAVQDELFSTLSSKKVDVVMQNVNASNAGPFDFLTRFAGPIAWLIAGLLLLFGGVGGGAGPMGQNPFELGKSKARVIKDGDTKVKFGDVAGCDGAKEELVEVVDFLKNTSRYSDLGAKIPKGALLVGPPGTGKTLLAKAVAGEAGVPFFSISASEFVEVFAGVGASRVRDLFENAKKSAPCIIFIDEIDAVGRQRSAGFGQGNDEREQTVNQLLTEMDGFETNAGVVVIAATNRADILDKALVRPGRFDRQIQVDPPDVEGRTAILKVHAQGKTLAPGVDLTAIARQTPGMSGADLANLLNEGAIVAARKNKTEIDADDISNALERIAIGLEKKDAVMSEKKKKLVAYHEAGHAILGALMNDFDVVAKISIVPRGPAGGVTIFMPTEERLETGLYSKEFLENRMCVALGGRIAEEILNGKANVTTGASNDFQQCTQVAQTMVTQLGMSDTVGQRVVGGGGGGGGPFMGRDFMGGGGAPPVSQQLKTAIDDEIKSIVDKQYKRGMYLLESNRYLLDKLSEQLMDQEKVSGEELMKLINSVAAEGKLVDEKTPVGAAAAYVGEAVNPKKTTAFAGASRRFGFTASRNDAASRRSAVARYGLAESTSEAVPKTTGEMVEARVQSLAKEASAAPVPQALTKQVAAQVLAALAATAMPLAAQADDATPPQAAPMVQMQQQQAPRVSGRATYSRLLEFIDEGAVQRVDFYDLGRTAVAQVKIGDRVQQLVADLPGATQSLLEKLSSKGVQIEVHTPEKPNEAFKVLGDIAFPLLIIGGLLFLRSRQGQGGMGGFGQNPMQSKAKVMVQPDTGVKFEDVAGIDEAKEELTEIVDFLKKPERFIKVGAKIPKGVLLTGPPGTGKTLMAKALAGESGVPFIQASASEFIEMFVGVGASRVRDIFKQAKEKAPCIVFIDEVDAIGRQRGAGMGGGNDEREQTLNQILTEMDGFEGSTGVIVVAATNRADILDQALLRPGRFDRRVTVGLPDVKGREQILNVHIKNKKLAEDIELTDIAKRTVGFSGADLENLMNESAILAARRNLKAITNAEVADATDRVVAGLAGRALVDNAAKRLIAYHEAGHALVGTLLAHNDNVNKVTLTPRGQAKGLTWFTPAEDQSLVSTNMFKARIATALGGRAAEQVVFGAPQVTSGAGGDLQQVERMARAMVTQLGMSEVGTLAFDDGDFRGPGYSEAVATKIDDAIRQISDEGYQTALQLLMDNRACLDKIADELCDVETMSGDQLRKIVSEFTAVPERASVV
eukprot:TRINITY_DN49_c0_g1_i4.p1 TRINITY_DN49_c0_g1~~TRINITY_DN49_c0_g1_i4.p1  ORF type:complete len:1549 (+),score=503.60 TRINITY_DN49_c0_g1_i4:79-4647(+)